MDPIGTAGIGGITTAAPLRVFLSHTSDLGKPDEPGSFVAAAVAAVLRARHAVTDMAYFAARGNSPAALCVDRWRSPMCTWASWGCATGRRSGIGPTPNGVPRRDGSG